jgi:energy-coupling factor transporter ATP-binding protein EcfA2
VKAATKVVLDRLEAVGFTVRAGGLSPFGEELPLVSGVAWDRTTAQVALVAHSEGEDDSDAWRELLFAASGLRHHLGGSGPSAFGTPLVLAIVDEAGERTLRKLVEELAHRYALFNRVDLNLVRENDLDDNDALDTALAPLLPFCRTMLGTTISREDVQRFWRALRDNITAAAEELDDVFGDLRAVVADELADGLIGPSEESREKGAVSPVRWIDVENLRSFASARAELAPVTVIQGTNGSGKSTLLEALELLLSGTSQRRPAGVPADEYARHLPRGGIGTFTVRGCVVGAEGEDELRTVDAVDEWPNVELARSVLTQDAVAELVNAPPDERFARLLAVTGLEIPELDPRTKSLLARAKTDADHALRAAGLPPLPRANARGLDHVRTALGGGFAKRLPGTGDVATAELALERACAGSYAARDWSMEDQLLDVFVDADGVLDSLAAGLRDQPGLADTLARATDVARSEASRRRQAAQPVRRLADALSALASPPKDVSPAPAAELSPSLAARWSAHAETTRTAAARFRSDAELVGSKVWADRLRVYADALDRAAAAVPVDEITRLARAAAPQMAALQPSPPVDVNAFAKAGFRSVPDDPVPLAPLLDELHAQLQRQAEVLEALAAELEAHPARSFGERAEHVLMAICRFELARQLRRARPIAAASEDLLKELLSGRLYPVVRELVAAMVRFEWYFEPLRITVAGRQVLLGGLATPHTDLDARMLLNSAERTVVGLAWFLALHLLQPTERRRVLVLDDPAGAFDAANRAGFVSTLRALLRLARPDQVVIATHDETVAAMLAEELSPVDGWPTDVVRLRCQRNADDASVVIRESVPDGPSDLAAEEAVLGLGSEPTLFELH